MLLFDERYNQELYRSREAQAFAMEADLVVTVGCSATVPVARILANYAVVNNAVVVDVNPTAGPLSSLAEQQGVWLQGTACEIVPSLVEFLLSK